MTTYISGYVITSRQGDGKCYLTSTTPIRWGVRGSDAIVYATRGDAEDDRSMFGTGGSICAYNAHD